jgi:hypothetical protein
MVGATVGTYIITRALKYNMPKRLVLRMMANQAIDTCVGVIPFLGDIFDFGFKVSAGGTTRLVLPASAASLHLLCVRCGHTALRQQRHAALADSPQQSCKLHRLA